MSPFLISVIGMIISLTLTFSIPLVISSRGIHLTKSKIILISIADPVLSYIVTNIILFVLISIFGFSGSIPPSGNIAIGLGGLVSFFLVKRILETSKGAISSNYPKTYVAIDIIKSYREENPLEIFTNGVCSDILAMYKNNKQTEQKIINSNLSPQEYAYNGLISAIEERLNWVAYRDQSTHELNKKGQELLTIQQKIIKDLENFKNPKLTTNVGIVNKDNNKPTSATEPEISEQKNIKAQAISKQVKYIVMDIDNKVDIEVFSERIAKPVWKRANDLDGIQKAFEKSGLSVEQFSFQSLIFEINNVLSSVSDNEVLSLELNPIKEMLERNYSQYSTEVPRGPQATVENKKTKLPAIKVPKKSLIIVVSSILAIATACTTTFFVTKEVVSKASYKEGYDNGRDIGRELGYDDGHEDGYNVGYLDGSKEGERKANEKAKEAVASRQTITLTPGVYKVGTDIAEGRYKLVAVSGHGYVLSIGSSLSATLSADNDYAQKEYTATLNSGAELKIDGVTIKFVPV